MLCTMKLLLLFALFAVSKARIIGPCFNETVIQNVIQNKILLKTDVDSPYQLAIDHDTNFLFFSYTENGDETFETVYINLKDRSSGLVRGAPGGFANAVDYKNQIVYIGAREGIYKFNYETTRAENLGITTKNIWQLFFRDGLYFTTYPEEEAFLYKDGEVKPVQELVGTKAMLIGVNKRNDIIYYHSGEIYKIQGEKKTLLGEYGANAFNTDIYGNFYFSTVDGIYNIDDNDNIVKIVSLKSLYGFAITSNNRFIYANDKSVFELEPTERKCITQN